MANNYNKRGNYFVKKEFQSEFILKFITLVILGSIISISILYLLSAGTITTSFENSRLILKSTADFILPALAISTFISTILIGLATAAVMLIMSHRIAGPMYKLERLIKAVGCGELNIEAKFRHTDEMKVLADVFNDMTKALKGAITKVKDETLLLNGYLEKLEGISRANPALSELNGLVKDIELSKKQLKSTLQFFKVK